LEVGASLQSVPESIIEAVEGVCLPLMPQVLLRFWRLAEEESTPPGELARLIRLDPGLAAHMMTVANSVSQGQGARAASLDRCLEDLGWPLIRTLAGSLAIEGVFPRAADKERLDLTGFWRHSLQVAELSRAIAGRLGRIDTEEAYLAGLLHDIGELLLLDGLGHRYRALLAWSRDEAGLLALERPELGTDHAVVGAWLIDRWRLPSFVADAVLFHHRRPDEIASATRLCQIVWAAHAVADWRSDDAGDTRGGRRFEAGAIESMLGLPADSLIEIRDRAFLRVDQLAAELEIGSAPRATSLPCLSAASLEQPLQAGRADASAEIAASVRDMAMLQPLQRELPGLENEADMRRAVRELGRIFFGFGRFAFLLQREEGGSLSSGDIAGQPELARRLDVPLDPGSSLAASVAESGEARAMFEPGQAARVTLLDSQIARALDREGVFYLPMRGRERVIGVMAVGLSRRQYEASRSRLPWLANFARLVAQGIEARRDMVLREKKLAAELTDHFVHRARRVAHEAGNPLAIINNYLKVAAERMSDDSSLRHELGILKDEIDRVARIVRDLNEASTAPASPGEVDANAVIEGMAALYRDSLLAPYGIELNLDLDRKIPLVFGSRDQLKQILLNLWKNAAEAMSEGGRLSVVTARNSGADGRGEVEIRVADTGPGLPEDVRRRNFRPLDPERRPGHAGMGLSIVAALVKGLDGRISYRSQPGQGTTFVIHLPATSMSEQ